MNNTHLLEIFFNQLLPEKINLTSKRFQKWKDLSKQKKNELAYQNIKKGEKFLLSEDFKGLRYFEIAIYLAPKDPKNWYLIALTFLKYIDVNPTLKEKILQIANKSLKMAKELDPNFFEAWFTQGIILKQLGEIGNDIYLFFEAKSKLLKSLQIAEEQKLNKLGQIYWQIALVWMNIAEVSGEAIDLRMSIQSFQQSLSYQEKVSAKFWYDFGRAYFQMGFLINDIPTYHQALECLKKSLKKDSKNNLYWVLLAQTYTQLYINSMDEKYFSSADECFVQATKREHKKNMDLWIHWAQLLGESGKLNNNPKKLKLSIEKCIQAYQIDPQNPLVISQWVESLSLLGKLSSRLDLMIEAENKIIKAADQSPDEPDIWYAYALSLITLGNYFDDTDYLEMAIEKINFGLSLDKTCSELWQLLATCYILLGKNFEDKDFFKQSINFFSKAVDLKPSCPSLMIEYAFALLRYAELSLDRKSVEKCIFLFENILNLQKNIVLQHPQWLFAYAKALHILAEISEEEKFYLRSIEILLHVLLIDPDFPNAHFQLALCFTHLGEFTLETEFFFRALNYYNLAVKQDGENEQIWLEWGLTLIHLAELSHTPQFTKQLLLESEQKMMQCGKLGNLQVYYHMACLYSLMKKTEKAIYFLEKAQANDVLPSLEEILQDDWLENIRGTEDFLHFISYYETKQNTAEEF